MEANRIHVRDMPRLASAIEEKGRTGQARGYAVGYMARAVHEMALCKTPGTVNQRWHDALWAHDGDVRAALRSDAQLGLAAAERFVDPLFARGMQSVHGARSSFTEDAHRTFDKVLADKGVPTHAVVRLLALQSSGQPSSTVPKHIVDTGVLCGEMLRIGSLDRFSPLTPAEHTPVFMLGYGAGLGVVYQEASMEKTAASRKPSTTRH
jgi:hypothetical protein